MQFFAVDLALYCAGLVNGEDPGAQVAEGQPYVAAHSAYSSTS